MCLSKFFHTKTPNCTHLLELIDDEDYFAKFYCYNYKCKYTSAKKNTTLFINWRIYYHQEETEQLRNIFFPFNSKWELALGDKTLNAAFFFFSPSPPFVIFNFIQLFHLLSQHREWNKPLHPKWIHLLAFKGLDPLYFFHYVFSLPSLTGFFILCMLNCFSFL